MSQAQFFQIKVPENVVAGQQLRVRAPNGVDVVFGVPANCPPGTLLRVPMPKAPAQPPAANPAAPSDPPAAAGPSPAEMEKKEVTEYAEKALFELQNLLTKKKDELKEDMDKLEKQISELKAQHSKKEEEYKGIVDQLPKLEEMSKKFSAQFKG
mmetsp:Transcript_15987/g.30343  ORF Transcript_15987/g.30343 Transcript_15987/m.30343 type:complete len:154 (-) Transcript_15987:185-646(-)